MNRIKHCPFCGKKAELKVSMNRASQDWPTDPIIIENSYYIQCTECEARSGVFQSKIYQDRNGDMHIDANGAEDAINAWNKREGNDA